MKLRILAIGRDRSGLFAPAVEEYLGRLSRTLKVELVELPEARRHAGTPRAREEEGATLLSKVRPGERLVALDERGEQLTSQELASRLSAWQARAQDLALVVGGAEGLAPAVLERAQERLALSRLTLPHRLARLVLVEQLYRAATILRGEPYHKE